jgi:hypothetical protein
MGSKSGGRPSAFSAEFHARDCTIRDALGRMLRMHYDVADPVPKQLVNLVKLLDGVDADGAVPVGRIPDLRPLRACGPF